MLASFFPRLLSCEFLRLSYLWSGGMLTFNWSWFQFDAKVVMGFEDTTVIMYDDVRQLRIWEWNDTVMMLAWWGFEEDMIWWWCQAADDFRMIWYRADVVGMNLIRWWCSCLENLRRIWYGDDARLLKILKMVWYGDDARLLTIWGWYEMVMVL